MIQLHSDYLVFDTPDGAVPCSAEQVIIELIGEAGTQLDPVILHNAAAGVLHYFKEELGREFVSVGEFSEALAKVLRGFGLQVTMPSEGPDPDPQPASEPEPVLVKDHQPAGAPPAIPHLGAATPATTGATDQKWSLAGTDPLVDLRRLACESGKGFELAFFPRLREALRERLLLTPRVLRFTGLRSCVKQLAGAQRWSGRCQQLNDQIVDYLRLCLSESKEAGDCALVVL